MGKLTLREHIINTAVELFREYGYHATGVDRIINEAGVSKKTLYTHFRSKEELLIALLCHYDGVFRNNFMRKVDQLAKPPQEKIIAIFDVAQVWFSQNKFFGCMFINIIGEYSKKNSLIRDICQQFKQLVRAYFKELCVQTGVKEPDDLADKLALLFDGAVVTSPVSQKPQAAKNSKRYRQVIDRTDAEIVYLSIHKLI
jgi:AcrR family transcriptional regulator